MPKPKRIGKKPVLTRAKFTFGKFLGQGQQEKFSKAVHEVTIIEGKRTFHAAIKRPVHLSEGVNRFETARHQRTWRTFKKLGLPVPAFSAVYSRRPKSKKEGRKYLSIFMENMEKKYGTLEEIHQLGDPVEFDTLLVERDSKLIKDLAKDLAKIHSTKYITDHIDFWHFYKKKNGTKGRVLIDFNGFFETRLSKEREVSHNTNLHLVKQHLGSKEWQLFKKEYNTRHKPHY